MFKIMGAPKKTDEYKKNYIKENAEIYVSRNKKNAETLKGYEEKSGDELHKVYFSVQTSVRNYNKKVEANTAETNSDVTEVEIATPKSILQDTIKNTLKKNLTYEEWKDIKEEAEKFVEKIEGKMKDAASDALKKKEEELAKLQADIAELKTKVN